MKRNARERWRQRAFRTVVGARPDKAAVGDGTLLLDTNDSSLFHGLFVMSEGGRRFREFSVNYLKNRFDAYSDVYHGERIVRPAQFLRGALSELMAEWTRIDGSEEETKKPSVAVVLLAGGNACVGRINSFPLFVVKDHRFRQVFSSSKGGDARPEALEFAVSDGDRILMAPERVVDQLTRLELKNVIVSEGDADAACGRLAALALRYDELTSPRLMVVHFRQLAARNNKLLSRRNVAITSALLFFIMLLFLWGDIARVIQSGRNAYIFTPRGRENITAKIANHFTPRRRYQPEEIFAGLAVPYDIALAPDGEIFIVDDRESSIVVLNPESGAVRPLATRIKLVFPTGIEVFRDVLYVVDFSYRSNRILVMTRGGEFLQRIPEDGTVQLKNPKAAAVSPDGNLYICDRGNNRVLRFSPEGKLVRAINLPPDMMEPNGIALAGNGDIYVSLKLTGGVARITGEKSVKPFALMRDGERVSLSRPAGIAIDSKGFIYVADTGNRQVIVSDPMGRLDESIDSEVLPDLGSFYPLSVKLDPQQNHLYIVGSNQLSYDESTREICRGKIWRVKL
ncbi:MAG: NHL repeat-containing protein [bacterium]